MRTPCKARGSYTQPTDTPRLRELLRFFSIMAGGKSGLQILPFAAPLTASQQTCLSPITSARSPPESLFILAPRAHADVVEQSCLRAEFFHNLQDCFDMLDLQPMCQPRVSHHPSSTFARQATRALGRAASHANTPTHAHASCTTLLFNKCLGFRHPGSSPCVSLTDRAGSPAKSGFNGCL